MIQCENLVKIYKTQETEVLALQGLDLFVDDGELMAIIGNLAPASPPFEHDQAGPSSAGGLLIVDGKIPEVQGKGLYRV